MQIRTIFAVSLVITLLGCNEASAPEPTAPAAETAKNDEAEIAALPEGQRNAVFIRAIRDAGRECQSVERSQARAPVNGSPAWTAMCGGGTEWIIIPFGSGEAQVVSPAELKAADNADNAAR